MMNKFLGLLILLFALNCKPTQQPKDMTYEKVVVIGKGSLYGSGAEGIDKANLVISNPEDWEGLLQKMNSVNKVSDSFSETEIDFSKYRVIAVFDDVKTTGGHSIALNVMDNSDHVLIDVIYKSPNGIANTAMMQPYYIAKLIKSDRPIRFK
ncbi:MAG: hypothetical protein AAFX55_10435 [Bacteroidota bacterium]